MRKSVTANATPGAAGRDTHATGDLHDRLDRVESMLEIQQLPVRYALAIDSRDMDEWVSLFVEDVSCGRFGHGRDVLKSLILQSVTQFYRSVHLVCGQKIDFLDKDHATGAVFCHAEHEVRGHWVKMSLLYFDDYARRDGRWYFTRRREKHWYAADALDRPSGPDFDSWPNRTIPPCDLPHAFKTWRPFWDAVGATTEEGVTAYPVGAVHHDKRQETDR